MEYSQMNPVNNSHISLQNGQKGETAIKYRMKPGRGLKALAAGSLAMAKIHSALDNTEQELEHELERENRDPPKSAIGRARRKGEKLIHTKQVLFCIIILNVLDCILVMGELILDMYYIKGLLEASDTLTFSFITDMKTLYPRRLYEIDTDIVPLYKQILEAKIEWNNSSYVLEAPFVAEYVAFTAGTNYSHSIRKRELQNDFTKLNNISNVLKQTNFTNLQREENEAGGYPFAEILAKVFHKASITILCILALETLFKIFAYGKSFFERKLEVFDCIVVFCSLFVDLYFLKGISGYKIREFVIILAFLVPWRVIRVVNSLIVAVMDHEHFRLKLLYKQKKNITNELKKTKADIKILQQSFEIVKKMAINEGVQEQKIGQHLAFLQIGKPKNKGFDSFRNSLPLFNIQPIWNTSRSSLNSGKQNGNNNASKQKDKENSDSSSGQTDKDSVINITENPNSV